MLPSPNKDSRLWEVMHIYCHSKLKTPSLWKDTVTLITILAIIITILIIMIVT